MTLRNAFKPHRLAFTTALIMAPFGVSASGFDVYRTTNDHTLEVRVNLTNASREYWNYPEYVEDESDSRRRRVRQLQSNHDFNLGPVGDWSNEINLSGALSISGNSVSTSANSKVKSEVSNAMVRHRTDLSYVWERDTDWNDTAFARATASFTGFVNISAPQNVLIEAYVTGEMSGFPGLAASIVDYRGEALWGINWPLNADGYYERQPGAEYIVDGDVHILRIRKVLTLAPGEYEFYSTAVSGYSLHFGGFPYDSAGTTSFSITAVPETESVALTVAGLLVMGVVWRAGRSGAVSS